MTRHCWAVHQVAPSVVRARKSIYTNGDFYNTYYELASTLRSRMAGSMRHASCQVATNDLYSNSKWISLIKIVKNEIFNSTSPHLTQWPLIMPNAQFVVQTTLKTTG